MADYTLQGKVDKANVQIAKHVKGFTIEERWDTFWAITDKTTNTTDYCFGLRIDSNRPPTIDNLVRLQTKPKCLKDILNDQRIIVEDDKLLETNEGESWVNSWKNVGEISHIYVKNSVQEHTLRKSEVQFEFLDPNCTYGKVSPNGLELLYRLPPIKQRKHNYSTQQFFNTEKEDSDNEGNNLYSCK